MLILCPGSNLGDRVVNLHSAINELRAVMTYITTSPIYESDALVPENAPQEWNKPYLNMVVAGKCSLEPHELLRRIKFIETKLGRPKNYEKWSPRVIDIDILAYDSIYMNDKDLHIPHKNIFDRPFFVYPLADIMPEWTYPDAGPACGKTAKQIADEIKKVSDSLNTRRTEIKLDS